MGLHKRTRRNGLHRTLLLPSNRWERLPKYRKILCGEMMKSHQLSERIAIRKDPSDKRNPSLLNADSRLLKVIPIIFLLLFLCSCGDEGLIDPHGETSLPPPNTTGRLHAIDFPTDTGSAWTYINVDTDEEFTLRVEGTRDVGGTTHRQMTVSPISPGDPDQFNWQAVDHLVANAFYLRFDTEFVDVFPFPIFATYFSKTPQALVESAFDIFLPDRPTGITIQHYKHFPPRRLWDFPLKVGKSGLFLRRLPAYRSRSRVMSLRKMYWSPSLQAVTPLMSFTKRRLRG